MRKTICKHGKVVEKPLYNCISNARRRMVSRDPQTKVTKLSFDWPYL